MKLHILKKDLQDTQETKVNLKTFWKIFLHVRNTSNKLTAKEIDILSDFLSGTNPEKPKGNYKTYMDKIKKKGYELKYKPMKGKVQLVINLNVDAELT